MKKIKIIILLLSIIEISTFAQPTLTTSITQNTICDGVGCNYVGPSILINEVMLCPSQFDGSIYGDGPGFSANTNAGEWIELYNPDYCFPKDISGFLLGNNAPDNGTNYGGGFVIPANTIVPSRGFCVIRGVNATPVPSNLLIQNGGNTIEIIVNNTNSCINGGFRLWFPNAGGWFAFYDRNGNPQDGISWASTTNSCSNCNACIPLSSSFAGTLPTYDAIPATMKTYISTTGPTAGFTFRRYPDGGGWQISTPATPTLGTCNGPCVLPAVVTCNGTAQVVAQGGTAPYQYIWNGGSSPINSLDTGLCGGTYIVTVTDNAGLTSTASVVVPNWVPSSSFSLTPDTFCLNNSATATYTGDVADTATFNWTITGGTLNSGIGVGPQIASTTTIGSHTVGLTVLQNGCPSPLTEHTFYVFQIQSNASVVHPPLCALSSTGEATANGLVGVSPYQYLWSNGNPTQNATSLAAGQYIVTVTDAIGCTSSSTITVIDPSPLTLITNASDETCSGYCNGSINVTASGSTPPYSYAWQGSTSTTYQANNLCVGSYSVIVTDSNNCTATATEIVNFTNEISAIANANPPEGVAPADIQFTYTGNGATTFDWRFGDGGSAFNANPIHQYVNAGTYTITLIVTSGAPNFCADTTWLTVVIVPPSNVTIPNIFTPNNDGFNDNFFAVSSGLDRETMKIYNRWGRVVFSSETVSEPWNGKNGNNEELSDGIYYYIYHSTGFDKKVYDFHGSVTLLR